MEVLAIVVLAAAALLAADRLAGAIAARLMRPQPVPDVRVVAHRGASRHAPENTLAAFQLGWEHGADAVECDVVFTADGVPVVSHHHDLSDRMPASARPAIIGRMTAAQVAELDVGSWFAAAFSGERVPTVAQALEFFRERYRHVYLHDKHDDDLDAPSLERVAALAEVVRASGMKDRIHVMVRSGNLEPWRRAAPDVALVQSRNGPPGRRGRLPIATSWAAGMRHLVVYASPGSLLGRGRLLARLGLPRLGNLLGFWPARAEVDAWRGRGASFVVFTLNDALRVKLYLRAGFQAIGTDDPRMVVGLLREMGVPRPDRWSVGRA